MKNDINTIIDNIYQILVKNKKISYYFYDKWGIKINEFKKKIIDPTTHGGYVSKKISISNLDINKKTKILDIGPEMGLEIFLLSELSDDITVCDPDKDNLILLKKITDKYINIKGEKIKSKITYKPYGIGNNNLFSITEKNRYKIIYNKLKHSLPAFYNVTSTKEINNLKPIKFDLIFIHKILTTISRSSEDCYQLFKTTIFSLNDLLSKNGVISWTEPEFVLKQKNIINNLKIFNEFNYKIIKYKTKKLPERFVQLIFIKK